MEKINLFPTPEKKCSKAQFDTYFLLALFFGFLLENSTIICNKISNTMCTPQVNKSMVEIYPKEIISPKSKSVTYFSSLYIDRSWTLAEPIVVIISQYTFIKTLC